MPIALLTPAGEAGRHLRDALAGSGTAIVYEAQAAELDREQLEKSGARVVVVNLDNDVEDHLDEVYSLLDDERYNVIFDEAQVSSRLSGWEQARWARHLAAKILGTEDADPPRPEGAEPVPQREAAEKPANAAGVQAAQTDELPAAPAASAAGPEPAAEVPDMAAGIASDAAAGGEDYSDIIDLLNEVEAEPLDTFAARPEAPPSGAADAQDTVPMEALDLSEFDVFEEMPASAASAFEDGQSPAPAEATIEMPAFDAADADAAEGEALGFGDLDDFADGADGLLVAAEEPDSATEGPQMDFGSDVAAADFATGDLMVEDELAEVADASAVAAGGSEVSELQMLDLDWADAPATPATPEGEAEPVAAPPPAIGSAFAWSLEDLDEEPATAGSKAAESPSGPAKFGIETISASEYLAPESSAKVDDSFQAGLSLELIPLDEAVAPQVAGAESASQGGRESWLDTDIKIAVSRVWVLGASIGGPEAVREFLAELPADSPALFLLAQHMGAEFMDIMAQQLVRSTALTVRTPSHGERVGHGDIVIVPTTHRLRVDREGVITLEPNAESNLPHSPSIDQVLRDMADRFGARSGAIVFSGMAEDAAEGAAHMVAKGGKVYVQDPETCVISSMVDGVIETGVVSFTGTPKALAEKVMGDLKPAAKG